MRLDEAIFAAVRANRKKEGPLLDPKVGQAYQTSLQRTLGGRIEDKTEYASARAYRFYLPVTLPEDEVYRATLRIRISGYGPYATHTYVQEFIREHWWSEAFRATRSGWRPEHRELLARLRNWYRENNVTEVDQQTQAVLVPDDLQLPGPRKGTTTLFHLAFGD